MGKRLQDPEKSLNMAIDVPEDGLLLENSAKVMAAGLPTQAFAITLSNSMIEDMIKCVQDGGGIQLALGGSPVSGFSPSLRLSPRDRTDQTVRLFSWVPKYCANLPCNCWVGSN